MLSDKNGSGKKNRLGKYLLYATGEIILVVIGIFIALQLNIRKENNILFQKQQKHLLLIRGEMANNLNSLETEDEALTEIMSNTRRLIDLMATEQQIEEINEEDLSGLLIDAISRQLKINHQNGALTELISSGGLKDVENDSVRSILASWEGKLKIVRSQEQSLYKYLDKLNDLAVELGSYRTLFEDIEFTEDLDIRNSAKQKSNKPLLRSIEFENTILSYLAISYTLHNRNYDSFRVELNSLIR